MLAEARKLNHLWIGRSTLADANKRCPEHIFGEICRQLSGKIQGSAFKGAEVYVTKMNKLLRYKILKDTAYQTPDGLMEVRAQEVVFTKKLKDRVTLIANLLLMVMQKGLRRQWSFSGLATMVRISLVYYIDFYSLFNNSEKDCENVLFEASERLPELTLFD